MHALRCALSLVSLVFGEVFFGGSTSLHVFFLHFLAKCFFCNLFWGNFLRGGSKCVGVNVHSGWCWNGNGLRMVCVVYMFQFILQSTSERPSPACAWGRSLVRVSYVTGT